jgi:hypothetical protein
MAPDEPCVGEVLNLRGNTAPAAAKWHGLQEGASVMHTVLRFTTSFLISPPRS